MDDDKQKALEAAGWRFGDAADFLEMTEAERQLLDARIESALAVRRQHKARVQGLELGRLTQPHSDRDQP